MKIKIECKSVKEEYSIGGNKLLTVTLTKKQNSKLIKDMFDRAMEEINKIEK